MSLRPPYPRRPAAAQRGVGIVETMVGILIGMVVVLVVYNTLILAEEHKRANIGVADAQITGQLTQFILGREVANGGAALMMGVEELASCSDWRLKPLPVAIRAGATANDPDDLTIFYSTSPRVVHPVHISGTIATPAPLGVDSPNGFRVDDWFLVTNRAADCSMGRVTAITQYPSGDPWPPAAPGGRVQLAYTPPSAFNFNTNGRVLNLGPQVMRVHYTVDPAKAQLNSENVNWMDPGFPLPIVPLAQNIVLMKAQYGVDTNGDNLVDCWTPADNANTCGNGVDYTGPSDPATLAGGAGSFSATANAAQLRSIKAVRMAIVVRSDDKAREDASAAHLVNQTYWLFNCGANDATCQGRIQISGTANTGALRDYFRYRIYETVIPLRNALWNQS